MNPLLLDPAKLGSGMHRVDSREWGHSRHSLEGEEPFEPHKPQTGQTWAQLAPGMRVSQLNTQAIKQRELDKFAARSFPEERATLRHKNSYSGWGGGLDSLMKREEPGHTSSLTPGARLRSKPHPLTTD